MTIEQIKIKSCKPFLGNPFQIRDDTNMEMLTESIRENGVMVPILVRRLSDDSYEVISGHRRIHGVAAFSQDLQPGGRRLRAGTVDHAVVRVNGITLGREFLP